MLRTILLGVLLIFESLALAASPNPNVITPDGGTINGGTLVTITGTRLSAVVSVKVFGVACTNLNVASNSSLTCVTGAHAAGTGSVVVTDNFGRSGSINAAYTYAPAPTITSLSPNTSPLGGGQNVVLTGTGFQNGATITINGVNCGSVSFNSSTSLDCNTGAATAGVGSAVVVNPDGQTATLANSFTYQAAPNYVSISPNSGPLAGGTFVTITGTDFKSGATVKIGGTLCTSLTFISNTTLRCVTPAKGSGSYSVRVTNPDGQFESVNGQYTYQAAPSVTSISPVSGPSAGGTTVTINGNNFRTGVTVSIGGASCGSLNFISSNKMTCVTTALIGGTYDLLVTNSDLQADTLTSAYTYINPAPTLTSLSPNSGLNSGGNSITLSGTGFLAGASVSLGGNSCTSVNVLSSSSLTCVAPAHAVGVVSATITNYDSKSATLNNAYTYIYPAPTVASLSPNSGLNSGGTQITISGTGFLSGATVSFGGSACGGVNVVSSSTLTCSAPAHSVGVVDVTVTNSDSQAGTLSNAFTYRYPAPTLSDVSPSSGLVLGGNTLTLIGTGFLAGAAVVVGGTACTSVNVTSSSSLTCIAPVKGSGVYDVTITNIDFQSATLSNAYTYLPPPTLTAVTPSVGPLTGGVIVTLTGTAFQSGAAVYFDSEMCLSANVVSSTQITCETPSHASGQVFVKVINPDAQSSTLNNAFLYQAPPTLSSVSPGQGPLAGGTNIEISGTGFLSGLNVTVDGTPCSSVSLQSSSLVSCIAPAHAAGTVGVTVTNSDGQSGSLANVFTFAAAPQVASVSPNEGTAAGGLVITLSGSGFLPGASVMIGAAACQSVTLQSPNQLTCVTPANASGVYDLTVTNFDSQSGSLSQAFTYIFPPSITAISPAQGSNLGGTLVTLQGSGFVAGATIKAGGKNCDESQVLSSTSATCLMPEASTGTVSITLTNPDSQSVTLPNAFTYLATWTWISGSSQVGQLGVYGIQGVPGENNVPGARDSLMTFMDSYNQLWLFGGFGYDATGMQGSLSDLWKFDGINWTWVSGSGLADTKGIYGTQGVPSASNLPGARTNAITWTDSRDNFYVFGGYGADSLGNQGFLNDLWKFDGSQWTWISGSNMVGQRGTYGTLGLAASGNVPGARAYGVGVRDSSDQLWIFGGYASDSSGMMGDMNDLWKFDGTKWTWMSGSRLVRQRGTYGTKGVAAISNVPGARDSSHMWRDSFNNFWVFGGFGIDSAGLTGDLNDLWKYDGVNWTWMTGSNLKGDRGSFGSQGVPAASNTPGARDSGSIWTDSANNLWLFGGFGLDTSGLSGTMSDLWKFDGSNWVWMHGSTNRNQAGNYGTRNIPSSTSKPGSRGYAAAWADTNNNLWIFGGYGMDGNGVSDDLNDLWRFTP